MRCNPLSATVLLSACAAGEKSPGQETGIAAQDDTDVVADDTADTGDSAPCEGAPDTGRLNICVDMDAAPPDDDPDLCDQLLPCVRSSKRCGTVEDQWAGWDLASGMVGAPQLPGAVGEYGYYGMMNVYLLDDVVSSGWLADAVVLGEDENETNHGFGYSLSIGADLDGDGISDLAVGTPFSSVTTTRHGAVLLYAGPVEAGRTPEDADSRIRGLYYDDYFGEALAPVPDVNDDGYDELLTGVYNADTEGWPRSRLFLGPVDADASVDAAAASYYVDYNEYSSPGDDTLAVDMTGDGVAELLLSDSGDVGGGVVWVVDPAERGLINLMDSVGVFGTPQATISGWHISAGDVTQDGVADLAIEMNGQSDGDQILNWGIIVAGPITQPLDVFDAVATYGQSTDANWTTVPALVGDLNGDGISGDLLVGTPGTDGLHLLPAPLCGTYELDRHTVLTQSFTSDQSLGRAIVPLPDVDGDGYDDVLISAPFDDEGATDAGAVYTLFGGSW